MEWSFGNVMEQWLYGELGYYHHAHIGKGGDFYTAVSASRFFGGAIARHILTLLESSQLTLPLHIVEIGAHHGELLCDIYDFLDVLSEGVLPYTKCTIIEPLATLQTKARLNIASRTIMQANSFDDVALGIDESVFVVSNELFDAFACEIVCERGGHREMLCGFTNGQNIVDSRESLRLEWQDFARAKNAREIDGFMQHYGLTSGEIPLGWVEFVRGLCSFAKGAKCWRFLSFDYAPLGSRGLSLRGYGEHRIFDLAEIMRDAPKLFGRIDLTYNVDFTLLRQIFIENGAREIFCDRLNTLLVEFGITELLQSLLEINPRQYEIEALRVRQLLGGGLGEKFMGVCFGG
ncbi:SAM-dependent methyltransferase [Helicobacter sp.]|uniref:SAM-dependent methyltransferase n=1 Tax=Helicobacter sp. TaxID=218 RepID=UPI0025BA37CA|nr:SAM-dependent methyltransferase [Helicobacter sp.]MBR2494676.1 SAM-dependent methyltransferase [Helicobacter sp.]